MLLSYCVGCLPRSSLGSWAIEMSCRESLRAKNRRHDDLGAGVEVTTNGAKAGTAVPTERTVDVAAPCRSAAMTS